MAGGWVSHRLLDPLPASFTKPSFLVHFPFISPCYTETIKTKLINSGIQEG